MKEPAMRCFTWNIRSGNCQQFILAYNTTSTQDHACHKGKFYICV